MDRNQPDFTDHYNAFVYRASYQALERSKAYSASERSIGYSQK
ncbi:inovirus Gp2 family protein [Hafnia alvei]|nr:inovirus Gp2 family protein [Hafnia alvei]